MCEQSINEKCRPNGKYADYANVPSVGSILHKELSNLNANVIILELKLLKEKEKTYSDYFLFKFIILKLY